MIRTGGDRRESRELLVINHDGTDGGSGYRIGDIG